MLESMLTLLTDSLHLFAPCVANGSDDEIIQYLIDNEARVYEEIRKGAGWDCGNRTWFAGFFTPLMMAANMVDEGSASALLKTTGKVDTELLRTGCSMGLRFPTLSPRWMLQVEYGGEGFCFNAFHIASFLDRDIIVLDLLEDDHADQDARMGLSKQLEEIDFDNRNVKIPSIG
jgi:hypothetical protein